ncbi:winged helix-turn-helix transcriptional regulator [Leifsonia xyli]|uniref:winged helix-turn-helix transcriptional regulator n=1 Tax=Leifsonia xyli TaxID=1575 RepID=UPI0003FD115D|nr:winged helix-turn-helix transcriptional regulator [Leifsonia xyli]
MTGRWGILVLGTLREGTRRFSELHRALGGVSEKMLAQTLRVLERDGLVHRVAYPVVPPKVEYSLTHRGREIAELTVRLVGWVEGNTPTIIAERTDRQGTV